MEGTSDAGAMLATVILVWKAQGPIMGIYNWFSKFQSIKASSAQINNLMSMNDDKLTLEKAHRFACSKAVLWQWRESPLCRRGNRANQPWLQNPTSIKVVVCVPTGCENDVDFIIAGLEDRYQGAVSVDGYNIKQFNSYRYRYLN